VDDPEVFDLRVAALKPSGIDRPQIQSAWICRRTNRAHSAISFTSPPKWAGAIGAAGFCWLMKWAWAKPIEACPYTSSPEYSPVRAPSGINPGAGIAGASMVSWNCCGGF